MTFDGLDYNTSRSKLRMPEYGRCIHLMVEHCVALESKEERQQCAQSIIDAMARMKPEIKNQPDYVNKLWDHLAIISNFKLDIDYPCDVTTAEKIAEKPNPIPYPAQRIPVRHYGALVFRTLEHLKGMAPGPERDELTRLVANQMKRDIDTYGNAAPDNERVISDIRYFTDGVIEIDPTKFVFEYINLNNLLDDKKKKKKK